MSFWRKIFGQSQEQLEELRDESDISRVSCMDVVRTIRKRVAEFKRTKGMIVALLEGCRVQIYFFDGIARTSWEYVNNQFLTDRVGETFIVGPPMVFALTINTESLLPGVLKREFAHCEMSIGNLWQLDPTAWDYKAQKLLHGDDVGIRISFDHLPSA